MTAKRVQWGLVIVTTSLLATVHLVSGGYQIAACSLVGGLIWLLLEINGRRRLSSFFFVGLIGVAVLGMLNRPASLGPLSVPILALGVSTGLAAWDLSRFLARLAFVPRKDALVKLEQRHLHLLLITLGCGLVVILPAMVIRIPLGFGVVFMVVLLLMFVLRRSLLGNVKPT
jgi:hypothetical protein